MTEKKIVIIGAYPRVPKNRREVEKAFVPVREMIRKFRRDVDLKSGVYDSKAPE